MWRSSKFEHWIRMVLENHNSIHSLEYSCQIVDLKLFFLLFLFLILLYLKSWAIDVLQVNVYDSYKSHTPSEFIRRRNGIAVMGSGTYIGKFVIIIIEVLNEAIRYVTCLWYKRERTFIRRSYFLYEGTYLIDDSQNWLGAFSSFR